MFKLSQKDRKRLSVLSHPAAVVDRYVLWSVLLLSAFGILAVYSAIGYLADVKADGNTERLLLIHVAKIGIALVIMGALSQIRYQVVARFSKVFLLASILLLIWVQFAGVERGGALRSVFGFQPSDIARLALILHVAVLLARKQPYIREFKRGFVPIMFWVLFVTVLIGMQDVSTAAVVLMIVLIMSFVGRMKVTHLAGLGVMGLLFVMMMLMIFPERAARVESWLGVKIFAHTNEEVVFSNNQEGYQADQARIAIAMGGLTGVGAGKSQQRDFIPDAYNDFIFAVITEEYGMLGGLFLLGVFILILIRGFLRIARNAPDPLGFFVALGVTLTLCLYGMIHICVVTGLMPVTGLPLPFVSYGGTSMVAMGAMVGILLNVSGQVNAVKARAASLN